MKTNGNSDPNRKKTVIRDPKKYKTVMCNKMKACNHCDYGYRCQFAHSEEELRPRQDLLKCGECTAEQEDPEQDTGRVSALGDSMTALTAEDPGFFVDKDTGELWAVDQSQTALNIRRQLSSLLGGLNSDDENSYDENNSTPKEKQNEAAQSPLEKILWTKQIIDNFHWAKLAQAA